MIRNLVYLVPCLLQSKSDSPSGIVHSPRFTWQWPLPGKYSYLYSISKLGHQTRWLGGFHPVVFEDCEFLFIDSGVVFHKDSCPCHFPSHTSIILNISSCTYPLVNQWVLQHHSCWRVLWCFKPNPHISLNQLQVSCNSLFLHTVSKTYFLHFG
jgi:hypothetical protein